MKLSFDLFSIAILLVCVWFFVSNRKIRTFYRNFFASLMWFAIIMYLNHIWGACMEEGIISYSVQTKAAQVCIHYVLTSSIYSMYAYLIGTLLYQFQYLKVWKKLLLWIPNLALDALIISSVWNGLIFSVDGLTIIKGSLFYIMFGVRVGYAIFGTILALANSKLLPRIFGNSVLLVSFFSAFEFVVFLATDDETLYYSTLVINIVVITLALTVVEFYKDIQTGLLNLDAFEQYIGKELNTKKERAVILIKLKNYSYLKNNSQEYALIDTIKELAECIKAYSMLSSIYYLGEGRFALIIPKKSSFEEENFFNKLEERFKVPFDVNGASISFNLFAAVIHLGDNKINKNNFWKFFLACDNMKYKSNAAIEVVYGDNFGIDQLQRYKDVEDAIDRALVENEFKMYYQPIVSSETKKVISCEGLIRLYDRVLGFVSPEEFIPISEGNGKILDISEFVIDQVFSFVASNNLEELGLKYIEMNLSMVQCMDSKLPEKLKYYSDKYKIKPEFINLEITETATNYDEENLKKQLLEIKKLGFSFSLDDYGTGYSNLVRVLEYPVDIIKLDKTIIWSAFHNQDNYATVKNLISMFHDVRRKLVAEGVENAEQMMELTEIGCDLLQGYYFSKPVPEEDFIKFTHKFNSV